MRSAGGLILIVGIMCLFGALGMDTSVPSGSGRVNNLGLMNDQQNYILIASVMLIAGLIMMLISGGSADEVAGTRSSEHSKNCPQCAETIKLDAKVCRYCGNREFPAVRQSSQPRRTLFDIMVWDRTQNRR